MAWTVGDKVLNNVALDPIAFESKSLSSMELQYSNIELRGPWHITRSGDFPPLLHCQGSKCNNRSQTIAGNGQQRHHSSVTVATEHNAVLSPIQHTHIVQVWTHLYIVDCISHHSHTEDKDQEIYGLSISMAIDVWVCTSIEDITNAMSIDAELQISQTYISKKLTTEHRSAGTYFRWYLPMTHDLAIINGVAMKGN